MKNRALVLSGLVAGIATFVWLSRPFPTSTQPSIDKAPSKSAAPAQTASAVISTAQIATALNQPIENPSSSTNTPMPSTSALNDAIRTAAVDLAVSPDRATAHAVLAQLRSKLEEDPMVAVAACLDFLESGADANTGLVFKVGPAHALSESPSLRVALLDWLGQMDRDAAAEYAEKILAEKRSSDEWAVALRNYANGSQPDPRRLEAWTREMLRHEPWLENPSAGFLEAFDTAVHLKRTGFVPELSRLFEPGHSQALTHASFVALDRLALAAPAEVLPEVAADHALAQQPGIRAALMTRADVRDPAQLATLEGYLKLRDLTREELEQFGGLFPNGNFFLSHNLLTEPARLDWTGSAARDLASLKQVQRWQSSPEFTQHSNILAELESRLTRRVQSAIRGGLLAENSIGTELR